MPIAADGCRRRLPLSADNPPRQPHFSAAIGTYRQPPAAIGAESDFFSNFKRSRLSNRRDLVICSHLQPSACICARILLHTFRTSAFVLFISALSYSAVDLPFAFPLFLRRAVTGFPPVVIGSHWIPPVPTTSAQPVLAVRKVSASCTWLRLVAVYFFDAK